MGVSIRRSLLPLVAMVSGFACGDEGGRASAGAAPEKADAGATDAMPGPVAATYAAAGPWTVTTCAVAAASAPCLPVGVGTSDASPTGALYLVFHPTDLGAGGSEHPILTWGNGTGAAPGQYSVLLTHLASWGFVVIASTSPNTGTGGEMLAGEDYLVAADANAGSSFCAHLDVAHVGAIGHSQGADGAVHALLGADAPGSAHRFIAPVLPIELPAQEWTCFGSSDPACPPAESFDSKDLLYGSVFFVDGSKDTLISPPTQTGATGEESVQAYYAATPTRTPRVKATLVGADHNDIQDHCTAGFGCAGVGPHGYLGYVTAWLMYQLRGDARAREAFAGKTPALDADPAWEHQDQASLP